MESTIVFTGPLTWTNKAACSGQTSLFFPPPGERPEAEEDRAAAGFRVEMPVGRVARYPKGDGAPVVARGESAPV